MFTNTLPEFTVVDSYEAISTERRLLDIAISFLEEV